MEVIIHPIVIRFNEDETPVEVSVERNNIKWKKMLDELKNACKVYEGTYGLKVQKINRLNDDFIVIKLKLSDEIKYLQYGNTDDIGETLVSFINWDLSHGDYPSFYKHNTENSKKIDKFITVER